MSQLQGLPATKYEQQFFLKQVMQQFQAIDTITHRLFSIVIGFICIIYTHYMKYRYV